ncbi:hypothetical protein CYMTET_22297 [Cymbomonas tetramitiformis]|uniref:RWP-RK domain-containing protein n=1 Tax=Cymbomonas tetramitiformis TaxID=36881 RepID=A0AAE0L2A1_9CHLO|nr:hypothetical protein CYMTET_22297 [Cymbomonas tetramitiformis]
MCSLESLTGTELAAKMKNDDIREDLSSLLIQNCQSSFDSDEYCARLFLHSNASMSATHQASPLKVLRSNALQRSRPNNGNTTLIVKEDPLMFLLREDNCTTAITDYRTNLQELQSQELEQITDYEATPAVCAGRHLADSSFLEPKMEVPRPLCSSTGSMALKQELAVPVTVRMLMPEPRCLSAMIEGEQPSRSPENLWLSAGSIPEMAADCSTQELTKPCVEDVCSDGPDDELPDGGEMPDTIEEGLARLRPYFRFTIKQAAGALGIGPTHLKKICRKYGIDRWPCRKIESVLHLINNLEEMLKNNVSAKQAAKLKAGLESAYEWIKMIEQQPSKPFAGSLKNFRQHCFKAKYKNKIRTSKRLKGSHCDPAACKAEPPSMTKLGTSERQKPVSPGGVSGRAADGAGSVTNQAVPGEALPVKKDLLVLRDHQDIRQRRYPAADDAQAPTRAMRSVGTGDKHLVLVLSAAPRAERIRARTRARNVLGKRSHCDPAACKAEPPSMTKLGTSERQKPVSPGGVSGRAADGDHA